ncbi:MAG: hypothetical protein R3F55_07790 [Alphaproteobacteria bacterium]
MPLPAGDGNSSRRRKPTPLSYVPFMGVVALIYLVVGLISSTALPSVLFTVNLFSGAPWALTVSQLILIFGLVALLVELLKALRVGGHSAVDHMLSMVVFVLCLLAFLLWDVAGTSDFLLLTLMALVDIMAGFAVSLATARRDIAIGGD